MKRPALSIALALGATLVMTVTAAASSTYTDSIGGTELPNATPTEGQFVGEAAGGLSGTWYSAVRQLVGFSGCTNQHYAVHGQLSNVGVDWGTGSGTFDAKLTHYRVKIWWV